MGKTVIWPRWTNRGGVFADGVTRWEKRLPWVNKRRKRVWAGLVAGQVDLDREADLATGRPVSMLFTLLRGRFFCRASPLGWSTQLLATGPGLCSPTVKLRPWDE